VQPKYRRVIKNLYDIFGLWPDWLNLPKDDHHFYYIFPWMIPTLTHPFFWLLSSSLESKNQNSSDFEGFQLPQVREKKK
jgi:hypothetical protein